MKEKRYKHKTRQSNVYSICANVQRKYWKFTDTSNNMIPLISIAAV